MSETESADILIRVRLIERRMSSSRLHREVNERLEESRRRSERTVYGYVCGAQHPDSDWIAAAEAVLDMAPGALLNAFAARRSPQSVVRTAAHPAPQR